VDQSVDEMFEHHPVRDPPSVTTQRMIRVELGTLGQQRGKLDPDGFQHR
jgi:hypothetical protein